MEVYKDVCDSHDPEDQPTVSKDLAGRIIVHVLLFRQRVAGIDRANSSYLLRYQIILVTESNHGTSIIGVKNAVEKQVNI